MKYILGFLVCCFYFTDVNSQRIEIQGCMVSSLSSVEVSSPYTRKSFNLWYFNVMQIAYFYKLKNDWALCIRGSFYDPLIEMEFKENPSRINGIGSASGTLFNLAILSEYKYSLLSKMNINFYIGFNNSYYLHYEGLEVNLDISDNIIKYNGENNGFTGFQIRPEFAFGAEWLLLKYFSIECKLAYIQGTRRIQEIEAWYSFLGGQEYYAKNYSNGSMLCPSLSLSYYFGGSKKF